MGRARRGAWHRPIALALCAAAFVALGLVTAPAATGQAPGERTRTTYEGEAGSRVYELFVPAALDPGPRPLVVYLHGCTQDAPDVATGTRFDELADERGFLVAYPEQDPDANGSLCWNWFRPEHQARGAGEPAIIAGIVEEISARFPVDAARVYVSGASAGGAMAVVLGATYPDRFAAVAVHAGCAYRGLPCLAAPSVVPVAVSAAWAHEAMGPHARIVPVFAVQGDADRTVPPANTEQVVQQWLATDDLADDGEANGSIPTEPAATIAGEVPGGHAYEVDRYTDASGCVVAERWLVAGMGHDYSGGDPTGSFTDPLGPDVTRESYRFFEEHPMPGGVTCGAPPAAAAAASSAQPAGDGTSGVGDDPTVPTSRTADPTRSLPATGSSSTSPLAVALGLALAGLIAARASRPLVPSVPTRRNAPCPDRPS